MMTKPFRLFWVREDEQSDYDMGTYPTHEAAEAAIPAARRELIGQCGTATQETEIMRGGWRIINEAAEA